MNHKLGTISLFTAAGFYGLYGIFSRLIGTNFGNFSQNYIRNIIVFVIIITVVLIRKIRLLPILKEDVKWIVLWLLSGSWVTVLTFIGFNNLQIGTAYLVIYSAMISAGFLSGKIFFKEKMNLLKTTSLAFSLVGLLIIYRFSIEPNELFYVTLVFISGFMTGIWNTISKKFSLNYPNSQLVVMDTVWSILASLLGAFVFKEHFPLNVIPVTWMWIFIYAGVSMTNVALVVYGFKNLEAQIGSIILPVEILFATIFSFLIFSEVPQLTTFIGGVFIILSAILPNLYFKKLKQ